METGITIEDEVFSDFAIQKIKEAAKQLPENQYHALFLSLINGYGISEIADILNVTRDNAKKILARAKHEVKSIIEEEMMHNNFFTKIFGAYTIIQSRPNGNAPQTFEDIYMITAGIENHTLIDYVEYNVQNEWTGYQNIDVRVTNTGTEPILNWALGYDAGGEIMGVYNGTVLSSDGTEYVIKNAGHNYEIAPNASANFGYTLRSDNPVLPEKFENLAKRVDISEGYDVQLRIDNSWNTGFNGFIVLTNTSNAPLEAWTLDFDSNFTVNDLWNGRILERADGHY